jgi:hypothetical protein
VSPLPNHLQGTLFRLISKGGQLSNNIQKVDKLIGGISNKKLTMLLKQEGVIPIVIILVLPNSLLTTSF